MGLLNGKIALVTGAGTGIGREAAILLAEEGATVVLTGRRMAPLREVAELIEKRRGKAFTRPLNIESRQEIFESVKWIRDGIGPVDILVNNAGSASKVLNARFLSEEEWNSTVNVNLTAVFNLTQAVLPDMIANGGGTVITVSSLAALNPPGRSGLWRCQGRGEELHDLRPQHLSKPGHPGDDDPSRRNQHADHGQPRTAPARKRAGRDARSTGRGEGNRALRKPAEGRRHPRASHLPDLHAGHIGRYRDRALGRRAGRYARHAEIKEIGGQP